MLPRTSESSSVHILKLGGHHAFLRQPFAEVEARKWAVRSFLAVDHQPIEIEYLSHIVPWNQSSNHRTNPQNGLCLSRLHDGAFDRGLITLDEQLRLVVSRELVGYFDNRILKASFLDFEGQQISRPSRFLPDQNLLDVHRQTIFRG